MTCSSHVPSVHEPFAPPKMGETCPEKRIIGAGWGESVGEGRDSGGREGTPNQPLKGALFTLRAYLSSSPLPPPQGPMNIETAWTCNRSARLAQLTEFMYQYREACEWLLAPSSGCLNDIAQQVSFSLCPDIKVVSPGAHAKKHMDSARWLVEYYVPVVKQS